jgi:acetate kinase
MNTSSPSILTLNSGSSSLKFALFLVKDSCISSLLYYGQVTNIGDTSELLIRDHDKSVYQQAVSIKDHKQALHCVFDWLEQNNSATDIIAVGHRIVHGGLLFDNPIYIAESVLEKLESLIPLAPNHQPANLLAIKLIFERYPSLPQIACFDTAFHTTRPDVEHYFSLPQTEPLKAVRRYGFHGLSYEYIAQVLPDYLDTKADGKIIVTHLGYGASLCAIENRRSVATTMTFTPVDGIPMGSRCGALDPAVVLYLIEQQSMTTKQISDLLYFQSGLLGVSGISGDIQTLLKESNAKAQFAIEQFIHHIVRAIGSLAAALGGLDALVFTGGIGEHAVSIRSAIAEKCHWLGLILDEDANKQGKNCISDKNSRLSAWVIQTDEEYMIAQHTLTIMNNQNGSLS